MGSALCWAPPRACGICAVKVNRAGRTLPTAAVQTLPQCPHPLRGSGLGLLCLRIDRSTLLFPRRLSWGCLGVCSPRPTSTRLARPRSAPGPEASPNAGGPGPPNEPTYE